MSQRELIKPISVPIKNMEGVEKTFILSRFPATVGREIIAKYPLSNMPKMGDYGVATEAMHKLCSFVAVELDDGQPLRLATPALIDNHVDDGEQLIRLELEMLKYNTSFFGLAGKFDSLESVLDFLAPWIIKTLIPSLQRSSAAAMPPSENSKP